MELKTEKRTWQEKVLKIVALGLIAGIALGSFFILLLAGAFND